MLNLTGGTVKRELPRVFTPRVDDKKLEAPKRTNLETIIDEALAKRDQLVTDLLDLDDKYDALERIIQDQIKNMKIPVTNRAVRQAVREFGGDDVINAEIYNKAKKTLESISTVMGLQPLHVPFAKNTPNGKALTQYVGDFLKNCKDIDWVNFPNKKIYKKPETKPFEPVDNSASEDGAGEAGNNEDGSVLTAIADLVNKVAIDIINFLQWKLFWDIIYKKFLLKLITFHPKILEKLIKPYTKIKFVGKAVAKIYCWLIKFIYFFENIPLIFGLRPPPIGGGKLFEKGYSKLDPNGNPVYTDLDFETEQDDEETPPDSKPYKDEGIQETKKELDDCSSKKEMDRTKNEDPIKDTDSSEERKKKIAKKMYSCKLHVNSIFDPEPKPEEVDAKKDDDADCTIGFVRDAVEGLADMMGTGINEKTPFQEGFIPPHCFEMAKKIIDYVNDKTLYSDNSTFNKSAVLLQDVVRSLRDNHEAAKFFITSKDGSNGSKALRENTANNPKYKQIYMNKDVEDFRDSIFKGN